MVHKIYLLAKITVADKLKHNYKHPFILTVKKPSCMISTALGLMAQSQLYPAFSQHPLSE